MFDWELKLKTHFGAGNEEHSFNSRTRDRAISPSKYRLSFYTRFVFHSIFIMFCLLHIVKNYVR